MKYSEFLESKSQSLVMAGFEPVEIPSFLFDFQKSLVSWSLRKGKSALLADCGLGKTPMELVWADNVVRKTNKPVLILTPLAVSYQFVDEGEKFGMNVYRPHSGEFKPGINVTNYERLHYFNPNDFAGCVCDEASILKNFDGVRRSEVTEFMRRMDYRLLGTATAAPNDYIELGTLSEALGELGYTDMLQRFFKNDQHTVKPTRNVYLKNHGAPQESAKWRFKGHAEIPFWKWVCSWARAIRRPSDLGFDDSGFMLPPLNEVEHEVEVSELPSGMLFPMPAIGLKEQRDERRRSITERCEKVADLVRHNGKQSLVWGHLNDECDLLEKLIPNSRQVSGGDSDEVKEEWLSSFARGELPVLITKPKIGAYGLNLQNCSHITFFPSHSYEQYYQGIRRCWRFGQKNTVRVDVVTTKGEQAVLKNLQRKAAAADKMFSDLITHMNEAVTMDRTSKFTNQESIPSWL